jgi:hypothetical protein
MWRSRAPEAARGLGAAASPAREPMYGARAFLYGPRALRSQASERGGHCSGVSAAGPQPAAEPPACRARGHVGSRNGASGLSPLGDSRRLPACAVGLRGVRRRCDRRRRGADRRLEGGSPVGARCDRRRAVRCCGSRLHRGRGDRCHQRGRGCCDARRDLDGYGRDGCCHRRRPDRCGDADDAAVGERGRRERQCRERPDSRAPHELSQKPGRPFPHALLLWVRLFLGHPCFQFSKLKTPSRKDPSIEGCISLQETPTRAVLIGERHPVQGYARRGSSMVVRRKRQDARRIDERSLRRWSRRPGRRVGCPVRYSLRDSEPKPSALRTIPQVALFGPVRSTGLAACLT